MIQHWKAIAGLCAAMIAVHVVNVFTGGYLSNFGIEPRDIGGAYTIAIAPMIHADVGHLGSNLAAFAVLGSTPTRYFLGKRMEHARRGLEARRVGLRGGLISTIAYEAGFSDLSYFQRCFRKAFGTSPKMLISDCEVRD